MYFLPKINYFHNLTDLKLAMINVHNITISSYCLKLIIYIHVQISIFYSYFILIV